MILDLNTKHNKAEEEIMGQLASTNQELFNAKEQLRQLSEQDYEERITEYEQKLTVSNNELDHAKRSLIEYINSLNSLEDMIKQSQSMSISENEEVERLRLENHRLNEENSSLISSKKQMDSYYIEQLNRVKRENQDQKSEIIMMSRDYDKLSLTINTVYKNLEIWREREQTIRENYDKMELKLATATQLRKKARDLAKSQAVVASEENTSLKEEHKKMEKL